MNREADGYAKQSTAYGIKDGKLVRAQMKDASTFEELLSATRAHFGVERALAIVKTDRYPKA